MRRLSRSALRGLDEKVIAAIDEVLTADAESKGIKRIGPNRENMLVSRPTILDDERKAALVEEILRIMSE